MKLIVAYVRPEQLSDVLEELFHAEVRGLTISRVQGHGGEMEHVENYRGTSVKMALAEKVRLEIGVSNHFVQPTIDAILAQICVHHQLTMLTTDRDFTLAAKHCPLQVWKPAR